MFLEALDLYLSSSRLQLRLLKMIKLIDMQNRSDFVLCTVKSEDRFLIDKIALVGHLEGSGPRAGHFPQDLPIPSQG